VVPREIQLNQDQRALSIGLLAVDYLPEGVSP
jgi:hypothetical protein